MITEEKIKAIKKMLGHGVPEGEIKEMLQREGYQKEDIDKVFAPHQYDMRSWYLVFGIIFFGAGLVAIAKSGNLLPMLFSAGLFFQYYRETERVKSNRQS